VAVVVVLPAALREYAKGASEVKASGQSLAALLADLDGKYPGIRQRILADTGVLREYVNVFVNGDQVEQPDPARVRIEDGDTVHIIPSVAGGSR
jgi:molybdopterin converting factor small subunit